jgi:hypothetical protein
MFLLVVLIALHVATLAALRTIINQQVKTMKTQADLDSALSALNTSCSNLTAALGKVTAITAPDLTNEVNAVTAAQAQVDAAAGALNNLATPAASTPAS